MATAFDKVWTGSTDSVWATATNWSPVNQPTVGQRAMIPAGTPSITCAGMADSVLASVYVAPGYTGNIGASGTRWTSGCTDFIHKGSGKVFMAKGAGATTRILVDAAQNGDALDMLNVATNIHILRGKVTVGGTGTIALIEVGERGSLNDAELVVTTGMTISELRQWSGLSGSQSVITLATIMGGTCKHESGTAITTAHVGGGGSALLEYLSNGTITTLRVFKGGRVNALKNRNGIVAITNGYLYPGSQFDYDPQLTDIDETAWWDWRN